MPAISHQIRRERYPTAGGCHFATDPALNALTTAISWTLTADPFKLLLGPSPALPAGTGLTSDAIVSPPFASDGTIRLAVAGQVFDIAFREDASGASLAALIILDDDTPDRLLALDRFWSTMWRRRSRPDERLTAQRRQRMRTMLRAVDGRDDGATYRAIGEALFPEHQIDAKSWVGNPARETTIRLVRDGAKLVEGGYRSLLRRPRRS